MNQTVSTLAETGAGTAGPVTFTATVTDITGAGASPESAGTVGFYANGSATSLGTARSGTGAKAGTYTLRHTFNGAGANSVVAVYAPPSGDPPQDESTSAAVTFTTAACTSCTGSGSIEATIPAGVLSIYTPFTTTSPPNLGTLSISTSGDYFSASVELDPNQADTPTAGAEPADPTFSGISVVDTQAGNLPWTITAWASALTDGAANAGSTISGEDVGLTGLTAVPVPDNALTAADLTFSDQAAANPPVGPDDAGSQGLGGPVPHVIATDAVQGDGTIGINGLLTITAPTSTESGLFTGTVDLTISG
jgi:hypothetical protein